jgi:outer membrane protein
MPGNFVKCNRPPDKRGSAWCLHHRTLRGARRAAGPEPGTATGPRRRLIGCGDQSEAAGAEGPIRQPPVKVSQMMRMMIGLVLGALVLSGTAGAQAPTQKPTAPAAPAPQAPATAKPTVPTPPPAPVPFPADAKVGFVDMQYVISESKLGKAGMEKIQALSAKQNTERTQRTTEIQKLQQDLQAGASVLTPAVINEKNTDLERKTREAQFLAQSQQAELESLNKQLLSDFETKVLPLVEQIRAERNLWLIFTADTPIAAGHPGLNLSLEVIKRLDSAP